jgi:hypothetical protein
MQSCLPRRFRLRHSPLSRSHCLTHSWRRESTCEVVSAEATRVLDLTCAGGAVAPDAANVAVALLDGCSPDAPLGGLFGGSVGAAVSDCAVSGGMESATLSSLAVVIAGSLGCEVPADSFSGCSTAALSVGVVSGAAGLRKK